MLDDLNLERWKRLSPTEQENSARRLARELPEGFAFRTLWHVEPGKPQSPIAEFEFQGKPFVLIPATTITLGYDLERAWEPTPDELKSWQSTMEEYELKCSIQEQIAATTLRLRTVQLLPLLMEVWADEPGWEELPLGDPKVSELVHEHLGASPAPKNVRIYEGSGWVHLQRHVDGRISVRHAEECTRAEVAASWAAAGFRFPTSDEWEYACGAGAPTLFRWGDHVPCDRYPTSISPAEAAWRRQWVLSAGTLPYPEGGLAPDWDLHRRRNALGLHIASNPYHYELVAEPGITRGGDGGSIICGGAGFFVAWLTLATAYYEPWTCEHDPEEPLSVGYTVARRVLPLL